MYGNGAPTGTEITAALPRLTLQVLTVGLAACAVAVAGATAHGAVAHRAVATSALTTGAATSASALPSPQKKTKIKMAYDTLAMVLPLITNKCT